VDVIIVGKATIFVHSRFSHLRGYGAIAHSLYCPAPPSH
jgi:hypothetical protein